MDVREAIQIANAIHCPPYEITARPCSHPASHMADDMVEFMISFWVEDVNGGGEIKVEQTRALPVHAFHNAHDLLRLLLTFLLDFSSHEVREQFRFGGVRIFDPHK